jgi:hypothetical protein
MGRAIAIVIGVDKGPAIDKYGLATLTYAENGAEQIATFARTLGYDPVVTLVGPQATFERVDKALREAGEVNPPWDTVLLVFSGHGIRKDSGLRCDHWKDEHWCLYNDLMVDDHLLMRTQKFAPKTKLFIVADCCFAGGGSGMYGLPMLLQRAAGFLSNLFTWKPKAWENDVDTGRKAVPDFDCSPPRAKVLLLASSSQAVSDAGPFMRAFLKASSDPTALSSFNAFADRVRTLGGRPVLRPKGSPLRTEPAFKPQ